MISDSDALPALLRQNFSLFLRFVLDELHGGQTYHHNWHVEAIEYELDRIAKGENRRLIVTMPPRHLKSIAVSIAWVAWMLGQDPSLRFICASYGQDLADKQARDCLRILQSSWYREAFPRVELSRRSVYDFETSKGGGRLSTSVGGVLTGRGAHIVIIDDPMKADDASSETAREAVKEWFHGTLVSRLDDQTRSSIILVMQRLHQDDLAGELLSVDGWSELRLPAIATEDQLIALPGGRFHQRRAGFALHAARQPVELLERFRAERPFIFAAQYQQDPVPRTGNFVDPAWFGTFDDPPQGGIVIQSWDTAVKTSVRNDWSVAITARYYQNRFYILDVMRKRLAFGDLLKEVETQCVRHGVERLLIEDASSGAQLIQLLRDQALVGVPFPIAIRAEGEKLTRFEAQTSKIESGAVVLPRTAPWLADFVSEIASIPHARHDDQADALAQLLANPPRFATQSLGIPELIYVEDDFDDRRPFEAGNDLYDAY